MMKLSASAFEQVRPVLVGFAMRFCTIVTESLIESAPPNGLNSIVFSWSVFWSWVFIIILPVAAAPLAGKAPQCCAGDSACGLQPVLQRAVGDRARRRADPRLPRLWLSSPLRDGDLSI